MKKLALTFSATLLLAMTANAEKPDSCKRFADTLRLRKSCEPLYARADALDCSDLRNAVKEMGEIRKECDALSAPLREANEAKAAAIRDNIERLKNASPAEKAAMREKLLAAKEARKASEGQ